MLQQKYLRKLEKGIDSLCKKELVGKFDTSHP